jgi:amino acid transporter
MSESGTMETTTMAAPAGRTAGLGLKELLSATIGVIVAQIGMVSLLQGVGIGGWGFMLALVGAFGLALANAMAFAEMALMLPGAGSLSTYAEAALGPFPAILMVFAGYVTPAIFGLPAELILADQILTKSIALPLPPFTWPVAMIMVFAVLNVLGTDVFAKVQTALSLTVLAFLVITGLAGATGHVAAHSPGGLAAGMSSMGKNTVFLGVVALAFWIFVGSEFVTPLVTEARNPKRDLPRAMMLGLLAIFVAQMLFGLGAGLVLPREKLASSPTPHLDYAIAVFGDKAQLWFALLAMIASASLLNTLLASIPRMLQGMAENGQVFPIFKYLHPKRRTPIVGIAFVAALPMVGLVWSGGDPNSILPLTIAASVAWLLAYVTAQVSLIVLRQRHPELPRPFRVVGYPVVPLVAIAAMLYVIANSSPAPEMTAQIVRYTGIVVGLFAIVGAFWVKFVMRMGLFDATLPPGLEKRS